MARVKLTARKHVSALPRRNVVSTESHGDGQNAGYFPRTLRTVLLALGYSEPPLFVGVLRLLHGNLYLWRMRLIIYERPTTDHIHRIRHVVEATTLRWTFEGGMRVAAREALALLRHEAEEQMEQSQYRHFPSHAREGAEARDARMRSWPHRVLRRSSEADSSFGSRSQRGHHRGQPARRA
jgi:hypothetical protein